MSEVDPVEPKGTGDIERWKTTCRRLRAKWRRIAALRLTIFFILTGAGLAIAIWAPHYPHGVTAAATIEFHRNSDNSYTYRLVGLEGSADEAPDGQVVVRCYATPDFFPVMSAPWRLARHAEIETEATEGQAPASAPQIAMIERQALALLAKSDPRTAEMVGQDGSSSLRATGIIQIIVAGLMWILALGVLGLYVRALIDMDKADRAMKEAKAGQPRCPCCRYILLATAELCPECGLLSDEPAAV